MSTSSKRPNFLVIVADDLGFSDLGCYGSEINTPNIDKLASKGLRFTDFHAAAMCSPTRSMIMTGVGNLLELTAYNSMKETAGNPISTASQRGMPGYEGYLNERVVAVSEVLRDNGYLTLMSGKWHLGLTPERSPHARGFTRSFSHLQACSNHFGWEPQLLDQDEAPRMIASNTFPLHIEDGTWVKKLPDDWYSSNGYGDKMLDYLKDWGDTEGDKPPFFGYFAFTAPHWPLQVPPEYIARYKGVYDDGPDALREGRLARLKELNLVEQDVRAHPVVAEDVPEWNDMTPEQQAKSSRIMEVFAGMVECIDDNVGKIVRYLEEIDELDNTFICVLSDNGAEGAAYEASPFLKTTIMKHLEMYYDNSIENIGSATSFGWYGPRWAQASTAPSRLFKAFTTEGGIRVPFVLHLPATVPKVLPDNGIVDGFSTVMDIMPTILQLANAEHPAPIYQGRRIVGMRGKSMIPFLTGTEPRIHPPDFSEGWELCGRAAIRNGDWKAVWIPKPKGKERWELFNLSVDAGEVDDVSEKYPEKLQDLLTLWKKYCDECGVIPLHPDQGNVLDLLEEQMTPNGWMEYEYWKKDARPGQKHELHHRYRPPRLQRTALNRVQI